MKINFKFIKIEIAIIIPLNIKKLICRMIGHKYYFIRGYGGYCPRCKLLKDTGE